MPRFQKQIVEKLAKYAGVPVWNGLTDQFHPTQMLADLLTMEEKFGHLKGLNFTFMGQPDEVWDSRIRLLRKHQVNADVMGQVKPEALFMHCLPSSKNGPVLI